MADLKDDFYKRFKRDGGIATEFFFPTTVPLLGGFSHSGATISLNLSFGTHIIARKRSDGRVIIADSMSDIDYLTNFSDLNLRTFPEWIKNIITSAKDIHSTDKGFELLFKEDSISDFSPPRLLGAKKVLKDFFKPSIPHVNLLNGTNCPYYYLASLMPEKKLVGVNSLTFETIVYDTPNITKKPIVIRKEKENFDIPDGFSYKERARLKKFSSADDLFYLMKESRESLLNHINSDGMHSLFSVCDDFGGEYNILPNLSGVIVFMEEAKIDKFIETAESRYEKKTGKKPAFYISD